MRVEAVAHPGLELRGSRQLIALSDPLASAIECLDYKCELLRLLLALSVLTILRQNPTAAQTDLELALNAG